MALTVETAQAWMKYVAVSLILGAISIAISGLGMPILNVFDTSSAEPVGTAAAVVIGLIIGLIFIGIAVLLFLLGRGIWNYWPWSRITMIVLGWLGVAFALFLFLIAMIIPTVLQSIAATAEPTAEAIPPGLGMLLVIVFVIIGLLVFAASCIHLWLFQFEPTIKSLFTNPVAASSTSDLAGRAGIPIDVQNAPSIVRGLGISYFLGVPITALFAIVAFALIPAAGTISELTMGGIAASELTVILIVIGIVFLIMGVVLCILGLGLWRLRNWARIVQIVLYALFGVLMIISIISAPWTQKTTYDVVNAIISGIGAIVTFIVMLWLLRHPMIIAATAGNPTTTAAAPATAAAPKAKLAPTKALVKTPPAAPAQKVVPVVQKAPAGKAKK
jgi:hypothetical protein